MWRLLVLGLATAGMVILLLYRNTPPLEERAAIRVGGVRTRQVEHRRIASMNVLLNGDPLLNEVHHVKLGRDVRFSGNLALNPAQVPTGMIFPKVAVVHHPVGTQEEIWSQRTQRQWTLGLLGKERKVDTIQPVSRKEFSAGEYELRVYLDLRDLEGQDHAFDFLGEAKLLVTE